MFSPCRQWLAILLMVLLPLQAFAGAQAVSCADWMAHCPGLAGGSDACCNHGTNVADGKTMMHGHAAGMADCAGATTCASVAAAAALPPAAAPMAFAAAPDSWLEREVSAFRSHIPDGVRRPPRFLA